MSMNCSSTSFIRMQLYRPNSYETFSCEEARRYLENAIRELSEITMSVEEHRKLMDPRQTLGKLLDPSTRAFYYYHFCPLMEKAVHCFGSIGPSPTVVELGCASGTMTTLFGLLGARVIGIDLDPILIRACESRKRLYESQFGRLDIEYHVANALEYDYSRHGMIDGFYSLFAFNLMQPSSALLSRFIPSLKSGGKLMVSDGNGESMYGRLTERRNTLTPRQLVRELDALGCVSSPIEYDCAIPAFLLGAPLAGRMARALERCLRRTFIYRFVAASYTIVANKQ